MKLSALLVLSFVCGPVTMAYALDPSGNYVRDDGGTRVRVANCGQKICATNTWIKDPASSEKVGDVLVMSLQPASENTLKGTAYDGQRKMTYNFEMAVEPNKLNTKGCVLGKLLCKDVAWNRIP